MTFSQTYINTSNAPIYKNRSNVLYENRSNVPIYENTSFLSVLIRTHRRPKFLRRCLDSINRQTKRNFIIVLISDYKEDRVENLILEYPHLPFIIKHIEKPLPFPSCNTYFNMIKYIVNSDYVVFIDDDDLVTDENYFKKLENIVLEKRHPAVIISRTEYGGLHFPTQEYWKKFPIACHISTLNFCVRSDIYKKFDWPIISGGDFHFISKIFKNIDWKKDVYWYDKMTTKIDHIGTGHPE